jgi:two-component system, OmpR family, sensor histidine kinase BaeS
VSSFAAILLINAINPDALIARVNISRMEEGKRFDAYYLTYLSADAAPVLVKALPSMSEKDRHIVEADLRARRTSADGDWRTWNLGRARARSLVEAYIGADGRSRDAGAVAGRRS